MAVFKTAYAGQSVKFRPDSQHSQNCVVAVTTAHPRKERGRLHILRIIVSNEPHDEEDVGFIHVCAFQTQAPLFDCSWSLSYTNPTVLSGGEKGEIGLWDISVGHHANPVRQFRHDVHALSCVGWNPIAKDRFLSCSSLGRTLAVWTADLQFASPISVISETVTHAAWNPFHTDVVACGCLGGVLAVWDMRRPSAAALRLTAHAEDTLCCDWSPITEWVVGSGSMDGSVRVWDLRNGGPKTLVSAVGHTAGVTMVRLSPHEDGVVVSCSHDGTVRVWNANGAEMWRDAHHRMWGGSVNGMDLKSVSSSRRLVATVGTDETVHASKQLPLTFLSSL